jgi:hypothetical protein
MFKNFLSVIIMINLFAGTNAFAAIETHQVANGVEPTIAAEENGKLHVAFLGLKRSGTARDVFYSQSSDSGKSWSSATNISKSPGNCRHPGVSAEQGGAVDVVWAATIPGARGEDIFFTRSEDGGKSWAAPQDISNTGTSSQPAQAVGSDGSIHVVWQDAGSGKNPSYIAYSCSNDKGKTWSKAENISNTPKWSRNPAVAVSEEGVVNVAWSDSRLGQQRPDIFYTRKFQGSWISPVNVSDSERHSAHPGMACGPKDIVYVVWSDNTRKEKSPDIWCTVRNKAGRFAKPLNISDTPGVSSQPIVVSDGRRGRVVIVWADTSRGGSQVYARISNDRTAHFTNVLNLRSKLGGSKNPHATIGGDRAFVIWDEDEANGGVIRVTSLRLKGIATGPARLVYPVIRGTATSRSR